MRRRILIAGALATATLAGCGGSGGERTTQAPGRVRLQVTAPADGAVVRGDTVDVRGRVSPADAQVRVLGRPALVTRGDFTVVVPLDPGANVVDVAASAGRRTPAFTALRVTRDVTVTVPDLTGFVEDDLAAELDPLGLTASVQRAGGILEALRSGDRVVCEQRPRAGSRVRRGRAVRVLVAKHCPG
jgi:hypothetical protein